MSAWTKRERLEAALAGEAADRPPVSAWRHFTDREQEPADLAAAMVAFQQEHDWDLVKVNPRATYYAETWGNRYDFARYDGVVPQVAAFMVHGEDDLAAITELPGDSGPLGEQLTALRLIRQGLGPDVPILQTLFAPLSVLEYLAGHRTLAGNRPADRSASPLPELIARDRAGVHRALRAISRTLADYVERSLAVGADGCFFAALGLWREGYLSPEEMAEFGRPYDFAVLEPPRRAVTVLHTCGPFAHPERFADYPVKAIHWADRAAGNPSLAESGSWLAGKVAMGGVDETLFGSGTPAAVAGQAQEALSAMRGRPFILAPGCGIPTSVRPENLEAFREAAAGI